MEKTKKAELLKMKQDADNRATRISKAHIPTRPSSSSTLSTQQRHSNGSSPRTDTPLACFSCGGPHMARNSSVTKKPNTY